MSTVEINGVTSVGNSLQQLLMCEELQPGDDASYQLAKIIWLYHPLGAKMTETPVKMAMSQPRKVTVSKSPGDHVAKKFNDTWEKLKANDYILSTATQARVYGITAIVYGAKGVPANEPIDPWKLSKLPLFFNVVDPLITSGSLTLSQDPSSPNFQKPGNITVQGETYHISRSIVVMNENPVYLAWTDTAFGYVGRSVFQRVLFPLKSFVQTMITDDMVSRKAGLLIAKMKAPGSIIDQVMLVMANLKRQLLNQGQTGQTLGIDPEESIESLNLQNIDGAAGFARTNILKNIATGADMPAKLLENETMVAGFGEGTEDAKNIAHYLDGIRMWLKPLYDSFDFIVQYVAWDEDFYKTMREMFPDIYGNMDYKTAFFSWSNSFATEWPSFLTEPESETIKVEDIKQKAIVAILETMLPLLDPENQGRMIQTALDNLNENRTLFPHRFDIDIEAFLAEAKKKQEAAQALQNAGGGEGDEGGEKEPEPPEPESGRS